MSDPHKPAPAMLTVHHLAYSRSTRVLWLLEEIGAPYRLVRYERDAEFRAPPELKTVHPLGKSPVIEDGGLVIGESAVILSHIDRVYGGDRFTPSEEAERLRHEEWLQYVESTAAFPVMISAIGARVGLSDGMAAFVASPLARALDLIASAVEGEGFIMGEELTLADIQFVYVLEMADHVGLLADHPAISAYLKRLKRRPALVRALDIGGPMAPPKR